MEDLLSDAVKPLTFKDNNYDGDNRGDGREFIQPRQVGRSHGTDRLGEQTGEVLQSRVSLALEYGPNGVLDYRAKGFWLLGNRVDLQA